MSFMFYHSGSIKLGVLEIAALGAGCVCAPRPQWCPYVSVIFNMGVSWGVG